MTECIDYLAWATSCKKINILVLEHFIQSKGEHVNIDSASSWTVHHRV